MNSHSLYSKRWIVGDQIEKLVAEYPDWAPYRNGRRDAYNPNCVEYLPGQGSPRSTYDPFYMYPFFFFLFLFEALF